MQLARPNRMMSRGRQASFLAGSTLDQGFTRGAYLGATPAQITTTRASTGYAQNGAGVWVPYAANVARLNDRGLTNENTKTNGIRNSTMVGAVPGSPGTQPTNWPIFLNGATQQIVGTSVENGVSYVDIRFSQASANAGFNVTFDAVTTVVAANGQTWTGSVFLKLVAGSMSNLTTAGLQVSEWSSIPAFLNASATDFSAVGASLARFVHTRALNQATTASAALALAFVSSGAFDFTLRIGWPQLEQGTFASTPIPTSGAAATRAADINELTGSAFTPWFTNNAAFTLYYEGVWNGAVNAPYYPSLLSIIGSGGIGQNAVQMFIDTVTGKVQSWIRNAGSQFGPGTSVAALVPGVPFKMAARFQTNEMAFSLNGAAVVTASGTWTIPTLTTARIGGGDAAADGETRRWGYIPGAASDVTLRALSS